MNNLESVDRRLSYIRLLGGNIGTLSFDKINELKYWVFEAYKLSSIIPDVANVNTIYSKPYPVSNFQSIGLRNRIDKSQFEAPNYGWQHYFKQIGRLIAFGEQRYFQQRIVRRIRLSKLTISTSQTDFSIINNAISILQSKDIVPDTIILPSQLLTEFNKYYFLSKETRYNKKAGYFENNCLFINGCRLKLFWSSTKYSRLNSLIIFKSKAGEWTILQDADYKEHPVVVVVGESNNYPGYVEYWVETRAFYQITEPHAFIRVNLSHD